MRFMKPRIEVLFSVRLDVHWVENCAQMYVRVTPALPIAGQYALDGGAHLGA